MATQSNTTTQESTKIGLVIFAVLIPLVGYISFFVKRAEAPDVARNYLIAAIVGSVLGVLLML